MSRRVWAAWLAILSAIGAGAANFSLPHRNIHEAPGIAASSNPALKDIRIPPEGNDPGLQIIANRKRNAIELYRLGSAEPIPSDVSIKLFRGDSLLQEIEMSAVKIPSQPGQVAFQGKLDPAASSFSGLEIRLGFQGNESKTVRWNSEAAGEGALQGHS